MRMRLIFFVVWTFIASTAIAQQSFLFNYSDPEWTDGKAINLEAFEYIPATPNGKVIIFSHGAILNVDQNSIKSSIQFLRISKFAVDNGYKYVVFMRKGRGKSEGEFTEQNGKCSWSVTQRQIAEAESQLKQVVAQAKARYKVDKVILMGHSRGGFLSSRYAGNNPNDVSAVVSLAGAWNAACQSRDGNSARIGLEESAKKFKNQLWGFFENDSFFGHGAFDDYDYKWVKKITSENGLRMKVFTAGIRKDGHEAPIWDPKEWATEFFPLLNESTN
jgi:pimeloyl-ACP methyl ester carboxylesterase